jgi:hypothetical protein
VLSSTASGELQESARIQATTATENTEQNKNKENARVVYV